MNWAYVQPINQWRIGFHRTDGTVVAVHNSAEYGAHIVKCSHFDMNFQFGPYMVRGCYNCATTVLWEKS